MWFTENAWQPMLLFILIGMACGIFGYQRLQKRYAVLMATCLLLAVATWFIERAIVTERERVHTAVVDIVTAFQQRDLERTLDRVSKRAQDLKFLIGHAYNIVKIRDDMRLTDIQVTLSNQKTRAKTLFRVNATLEARNASFREPTRWEATWQIEENEWRMIDIRQLDPISGNVMNDFSELRDLLSRTFQPFGNSQIVNP